MTRLNHVTLIDKTSYFFHANKVLKSIKLTLTSSFKLHNYFALDLASFKIESKVDTRYNPLSLGLYRKHQFVI